MFISLSYIFVVCTEVWRAEDHGQFPSCWWAV